MKRVIPLLWGLLLTALAAGAAPFIAPPDTTLPRPTEHDGRRPPLLPHRKIVVQYDSRYSIINHHFCTINGLKAGIEWRGRMRTGAAVYFLSTGIPTRQRRPDDASLTSPAELSFRYIALYGEYVLIETPRWELSANLQLGMGSVYVLYQTTEGTFNKTPRDFLGMVEPSVAAQMRVFRWAALGAGAGWRQPVFIPSTLQRELNGPVFYVRAKLMLGDLMKVVKGRERLFTQEGLRRES
jgi:hypothetical protein